MFDYSWCQKALFHVSALLYLKSPVSPTQVQHLPCYVLHHYKGKEILMFLSNRISISYVTLDAHKAFPPSARQYISFSWVVTSLAYFSLIGFEIIQLVSCHLLKGHQLCFILTQNHLWLGVPNCIQSLHLFTFCGCTMCLQAIDVFLNKGNEFSAFSQECRV